MKQVYSSKPTIGLMFFCLVISMFFLIFGTVVLLYSVGMGERSMITLSAMVIFFFLVYAIFCMYALNRGGCKVTYDCDRQMIYREGFFCGYKDQLKVENIWDVIVVFVPRDGVYYILVDGIHTKYTGNSKKSYIRLRETKENCEFVRQFWDKPIIEYRGYTDFVNLVTKDRA